MTNTAGAAAGRHTRAKKLIPRQLRIYTVEDEEARPETHEGARRRA